MKMVLHQVQAKDHSNDLGHRAPWSLVAVAGYRSRRTENWAVAGPPPSQDNDIDIVCWDCGRYAAACVSVRTLVYVKVSRNTGVFLPSCIDARGRPG